MKNIEQRKQTIISEKVCHAIIGQQEEFLRIQELTVRAP